MKLIEINWTPPNRQLRQFAVICLFVLPLLGWFWGGGYQVVGGLAGLGALIAVMGVAMPQSVKPIFVALTIVTAPIGMVLGELAMGLIYYGVFLPIGVIFRLQKRDRLKRTMNPNTPSYWQKKKPPKDVASYYRQG
jgi:hypothetical protein